MADKSPLPPVPPGVVQGYSDGFEYVPAHDGRPAHVIAHSNHWYLDKGSMPFRYQASMAKPAPFWWLNPISFQHTEWKPVQGKYYPHVGGTVCIGTVSEVVLMTMADFYKITPRTKAIRTYAVYQAEWRTRQGFNPHNVYVLGLEYMTGERQELASQLGGSDKLAPLVEPLRRQFGVGTSAEVPADLVGWSENVSEGVKVRERRKGLGEVETFINLTLDHWLLTVTEHRMIYRSRPVHARPDYAVTGPRNGRAAHYPVMWDVALDDIRTIEVRKLSELNGNQYKIAGLMGVVEVPDEYPSWTRAMNFGEYHKFWKNLGYDMKQEAWETRPDLHFFYNSDEWDVLFAFMKDGSRKVIWQTLGGAAGGMLKQQATIAGYLEKAKVARSSGEVEEQDRRNYL